MPLASATPDAFPHTWTAALLRTPPLIAPARQFTYPLRVPGEDEAIARGAILLNVKPATGGNYLATCALGFTDTSLPSGVFSCPNPDDLLALAGGYAYLANTLTPERCLHLPIRPVTAVFAGEAEGLLLLAGFHSVAAIDANGLRWQSAKLTWEGLTLDAIRDGRLHGAGWNMPTNKDIPFSLDLATGEHTGGGFQP